MKKAVVQKAHAAAVAAHQKAKPVFEKSEHAAALSYAVMEFLHIHELVVFASGALLVSFGLIFFGKGAEIMLAYVGNIVATEVH